MLISFTSTVSGHTDAEMGLSQASGAIGDLVGLPGDSAKIFSRVILSRSPRRTNLLVVKASHVYRHGTATTSMAAVGPYRLMGDPDRPVPRGTIKQFLLDHRAERNKVSRGVPPTPRQAWWYLTEYGRRELLEGRMEGRYGMEAGKPNYWIFLHRGTVPSISGVSRPHHTFIDDAHRVTDAHISAVLARLDARL